MNTPEDNYIPNAPGELVAEIRTRSSFTPPPVAPPAQAGKKTRALFEQFNAQRASFSNVGQRLTDAATALAAAREAFANSPSDAALDALASAKNAHDILVSTGVRNEPGYIEDLCREKFYTSELCNALQSDCEAIAAKFAKSATTARKSFADQTHKKIMGGEFLDNIGTVISRETFRAKHLVERLEWLRDYITEQAANSGRMARGESPITGIKQVFEALEKDPDATTAETLAEVY